VVLDTDSKMSSNKAYPWFFFYRIARLSLLVFLPTLFLILFVYRSSYKEGLVEQISSQMKEDLETVAHTLRRSGISPEVWCTGLPPLLNARYSLVDRQGKILCDTLKTKEGTQIDFFSEIEQAFAETFLAHVRRSTFFNNQAVFGSYALSDTIVLRRVVPISSLQNNLERFDRVLFLRIIPFAFLSYFIFLIFFFRATRPLGTILSKVERFKVDIPFNKTLQLLYKRDEWANIEEALNEADSKLRDQVKLVKTENEKIAAILESIYDDIIAIDSFETILFYNTNFRKNFMKERSSELMPKIWHVFKDERVLEAFRSVLKDGQTVALRGINFQSCPTPNRFFDLTITSLKSSDGVITGALGVFYDVTEFKLTEQMRVDFVANVSHEIRTPLTSIKGYTQILQAQKIKIQPDLHVFLEKILTNTERMISLFNDLLNLSVIESKNMQRFEELDLPLLLEEISQNIKTNYPQKEVIIEHDIKLETIKGDQRLLEQVLSNLIDNACKYSGDAIKIDITSYAQSGKAYLTVSDNGPGIPQEHLQRIFERFYRVDSSRESSRGTGLGLSIVKHIVAKHGGRIWAESQASQGTRFIIELPLS
jgi:two-component system, OmpR family, phosphate regulon sensor histidine kinase PhoR